MIKSKDLAKAYFEMMIEEIPDLDQKFLTYIQQNKLEAQLPTIVYRLDKLIEQHEEKSGITIETPHKITESTVKKIKSFLKAEDLKEHIKENQDLIAGFRAKWGGQMYDSSFMTSLQKLQKSIAK